MINLNQLEQLHIEGKKIIIFCSGLHGVLFCRVLRTCGITIDYFADSDQTKWGTLITEGIVCISPAEIRNMSCVGFICVGKTRYSEVYDYVIREKLFEVIEISTLMDWLICNRHDLYFDVLRNHAKEKPADIFYDLLPNRQTNKKIMRERSYAKEYVRVAVYTAVFGDYDANCFPQYRNHQWDYFYVSDKKPENLPEYYQWIDAGTVIPTEITSPIKKNRYIKMHPHLFLQDYTYSVYIDGNVIIKRDISGFIKESKSGIAVFMHPMRECIYYEALSIVNFKRVNVEDVCKQMARYFEEGMPHRYGLAEMPVIVREHMKEKCIDVMETWWREFDLESQRDQLSFMYALWRNKCSLSDLASLGNNVRRNDNLAFVEHLVESRNVKNNLKGQENYGLAQR